MTDAPSPEQYATALNFATTPPIEVEQVSDDPEERIAAWLATVNDTALRALDLQLLLDLLLLEQDPRRWRDVGETVSTQIVGLVQSGDLAWASQLIEGLARARPAGDASAAASAVGRVATTLIDHLAEGPLPGQILAQVRRGDPDTAAAAARLCGVLGPGIMTALADTWATEQHEPMRHWVRNIVVGFGTSGETAIRRLFHAPHWELRRAAVSLLRELGGTAHLDELEPLLTDSEPAVQHEAMATLAELGDQRTYARVAGLVGGTASQRATLVKLLLALRHERAPSFCRFLLEHLDNGKDLDVCLAALETLGAVGGAQAIETLRDTLYRRNRMAPLRARALRRAAARALRQCGRPEATQVLRDAAARGPRGVRTAAREQLESS